MKGESGQTTFQLIIPLILLLMMGIGFAYVMPTLTTTQTIAMAGGIVLFIICLASTEAALYILIFSMLLGPEVIMGSTEGGALSRGITLRLDDFILVVIGFSWFAKMAISKELGLFLRTPLNRNIGYYLVACLVSTLLGSLFGAVRLKAGFFYVLKYFEYVFVYFMAVNHIREKRQIRNYLWALLITCAIVSIIGIAQIPQGVRVSAPFEGKAGEPNTFGGYLLFMICITTGLLLTTKSSRQQLICTLLILLFAIPFIYTQSRASYLGMIPALMTFIWLSEKRQWMALICIAVILFVFFVPNPVKTRIAYTFSQREEAGQIKIGDTRIDTSTSARLISWAEVLKDSVKHPLLGFGVTGYRFVDAQYFRVLAETGIIGLLTFFLLMGNISRQIYRVFVESEGPMERGLGMGCMAGFVGLLVHGIGANTFIIVRIMEPFWFVLAMVIMIPQIEGESPQETDENGQ